MHPKVHVGSSVPNFMDDWTPLDIETDAASEQKALEVNLEGLTVDASTLQAHFLHLCKLYNSNRADWRPKRNSFSYLD